MSFLSKRFIFLLLLFCIPLIFLPKINILHMQGETAGLRLDDLFLFLFFGIFFWARFSLREPFVGLEFWMLILVLYSLLSFSINRLLYHFGILPFEAKIFYCFRLLEYFMFFYIGAQFSKYWSYQKLMVGFFSWNLLWMALQKYGLIGAFDSNGYMPNAAWRLQGIASFPNEMGILLNLCFCFFLFSPAKEKRSLFLPNGLEKIFTSVKPHLLFILFAILTIFTGSRISLLGLLIPYFFKLRESFRPRSKKTLVFIFLLLPLSGILIGYFAMNTSGVFNRGNLFSLENVKMIKDVWNNIDQNDMSWEKIRLDVSFDLSWWLRIHKWTQVSKLFVNHPECYLFGIGPGFASAALDGGILRILVEYGFLGVFVFAKFFWKLASINRQIKWMTIALLINMIFIDAYLAYKPMSLLFFIAGAFYFQKQPERNRYPNKLKNWEFDKKAP